MSLATEPNADRGGGGVEIDRADCYEILANSRRRYAVRYLRERSEPISLGELAEHVAAMENGVPVEEVTPAQRKSAYTALHQNHLAKLVDAGFVRAERRWEGIELTEAAARLDVGLGDRRRADRVRNASLYSVVLSATGVAAVASYFLGVVSSTLLLCGVLALIFSLLFALSLRSYSPSL
jgi:hypothetical protein